MMLLNKIDDICDITAGRKYIYECDQSGEYFLATAGRDESKRDKEWRLDGKTIIISRSGIAGYLKFINKGKIQITIDTYGLQMKPNSGILIEYVWEYFNYYQDYINACVEKGTLAHIYAKDILDMKIPIMSLEKQKNFLLALNEIQTIADDDEDYDNSEIAKEYIEGLKQEVFLKHNENFERLLPWIV